ncbi:MAG: FecR domain-containing protein [Cyclobacteriaceae bacterium]|nr:FecR domain-containing protein [Cyclobacteriaceae bacterium SS2]
MKIKGDNIRKFIHRKANLKDELEILKWVQSEDYDAQLEKIVSDELEEAYSVDELESEDLSHISKKIIASDKPVKHSPFTRTRVFYKYAATILLFCLIGIIVKEYAFEVELSEETSSNQIEKTNVKGRKSTIHLSDGSTIYLNAESSITYPQRFSDSLRIVELKGEAFFEVSHDKSKPFIVRTGSINVRVLGTSFNVRAFEEMDNTVVSLSSGKVELEGHRGNPDTNESVFLLPGQSINYNNKNNAFGEVSTFDPVLEFGWKDGILAFDNASVSEVVETLERWYNVDIQLQNYPGTDWQYKARHDNESLELVLKSIAYNESIDFDIEGKKVTIRFR